MHGNAVGAEDCLHAIYWAPPEYTMDGKGKLIHSGGAGDVSDSFTD